MKEYKLTLAYNGKKYSGMQIQDNANTIEAEIRKVFKLLFKDDYDYTYSSRTDAGVHALGQVLVLRTNSTMPMQQIPRAMNANLPKDIVIRDIEEAFEGFHPRYHAKYKTYRYYVYGDPFRNPLLNDRAYYLHKPLDIDKMQEAVQYFIGEHDFIAFSSKGMSVQTTVRTIYDIKLTLQGSVIEVDITGNGFLYNMVRIMVGALVQVGLGAYEPAFVKEILEVKDRSLVKRVAPAHGLTLMKICYEPYEVLEQ